VEVFDLNPPADEMARVLGGIRDDQLGDPTPCAGTTVGALISHVNGLAVAFADAARKIAGPTTSTPPRGHLPPPAPDWRTSIPVTLAELVAAWRDPAAWEGMTMAGGVQMSGEATASVASNELLLHGWDLAVATGQEFAAAPLNVQISYAFCSQVPDDPQARRGLFGPVISVPENASLLDQTLGFAGRDPNWRPAR